MKMLQSLAGKLNRLNDVREIAGTIASELRLLIDYHNCRVVLRDGDELRPIAFIGDFDARVGHGDGCVHGEGRAGHHRPGRRDRRVAARPERARMRVRVPDPRHRGARGVARRRAAALRLAGHRRDRDLEARPQPVRRGRRAPARGARRPRVGRARERAALRAAAARGREREGAARVRRRGLAGRVVRGDLHADRRDGDGSVRDRARLAVARRRVRRSAVGDPIARGITSALAEGDGVSGRLVLELARARRARRAAPRVVHATRRRSRCRRRGSTGSSSRPPRSRMRCSTRAASSRRPSRRRTCSGARWR